MTNTPRIGITLGDPRGIGPEVTAAALSSRRDSGVDFRIIGPTGLGDADSALGAAGTWDTIGDWTPTGGARLAGQLSAAAIERAMELIAAGRIDGIVTAPISKAALRSAGYPYPGHTEFLQDLAGVDDVTMMMSAERTPLGGPLRLALLTAHLPLRAVPDTLTVELVARRTNIALDALRAWWGIPRPRVAFAGLNPHAGEGGLFGDEEVAVFNPAVDMIEASGDVEILGVFPADTVFRKTIEGQADLIVTPYHDVGLAVLKTVARDDGVNITAGLPFPRTSPDHGTALDIAGTGTADPGAMTAAIDLCVRFCNTAVTVS